MIVTSTPYRVSFFGGGTDYPVWYEEHGGAVLAMSINRYCHIACRFLPPFHQHKHRIVWSKIEMVNEIDEIEHPAVREALRFMGINEGVEIHHNGDLPARAGLGSSSSFAVGILHALHALKGKMVSKRQLANEAIHLEQTLLNENVGIQDQITTAFGGLNRVTFGVDGHFEVEPVPLKAARREALERHLMLFYTGVSRTASDIAASKIKSIPNKEAVLRRMREMVDEGAEILASSADLRDFGELLHEAWVRKREISDKISNGMIDDLYQAARDAGAVGGKLLGAGGGGFMLFVVEPARRQAVLDALSRYLVVPIELDTFGTRISVYEPDGYSVTAQNVRDFVR
ncbi:MAG TPA: kinase [Magnetovibrio sp.]